MTNQITRPDQMYDAEYLCQILETEASRPLIESKRYQRLIDYSLFKQWLSLANLTTTLFSDDISLEELMAQSQLINHELAIHTPSLLSHHLKLFQDITTYLSQEQPTDHADLIFVMTSKSLSRMEKAVDLYRQKVASLILISGGHPFYQPDADTESVVYQKWAHQQGIPQSAMIIDPDSVSVADYARRGLNLLDSQKINFTRVIFVIAWYAQKRAYLMLFKYLTDAQQIFHVAPSIDPDSDISPQRWYQNDFGLKIIINEFLKMRIHDYLVFHRIV